MTDHPTTDRPGRLLGIDVEHLLGATLGPLVLTAVGESGTFRAQLSPADARQIAGHLLESAARAEYEADLYATMTTHGWKPPMIGAILQMVRAGEAARLQHTETNPDD